MSSIRGSVAARGSEAAFGTSCGLYAVVASLVGQRTREIGIRVSLGATGGQVRRLVLSGGATVTAFGMLAGASLAWWGLGVLSSQILGLESRHAATSYLAAGAVLTLASLAACWLPAQRATRINPLEALREE
jgi:ABC-type antimicrobial peptide transport system permease subunit